MMRPHRQPQHRTLVQILAFGLSLALLAGVAACSDDDSGDPCDDVASPCEIPGGMSCDGNIIQTCTEDADGCLVWVDQDSCPAGLACFGGSCVCDDECVPGSNQCNGNTIQQCTETIEGCLFWADDQDCAAVEMSCDDTEDATCVEGAGCGNDLQEHPEVCDGTDLAGESCVSQGFGEGLLACNPMCDGFDTADCAPPASCGNGVIEAPEVCDGSELGGADCESEGFHGGDLGCRANCGDYDTGGCDGFCGDGGLNGPEQCDTNDLGEATCESLGFYTGTLSCDASCLHDTSGCAEFCGDDVINGLEICDGTEVGTTACSDFGYPGGTLTCTPACDDFDVTQCVSPWTVTACWISAPVPSVTAAEYSPISVFGRVRIPGLTEVQSGPDPDGLVRAEVGVGPDGSDPSQSPTGWDWREAQPNPAFSHATDDEYEGELVLPSATDSPYDYAYRFSVDAGQTWVYCDRTDMTYTPADAGHLVTTP